MAIDTTGKWWVGDQPEDLNEYLRALTADARPIQEFRIGRCGCNCTEFRLDADPDEGVARRTCASCGQKHFICDSGEFWEDAEPKRFKCVGCKSTVTNIGVGFALYDDGEVKWLYIGVRCAKCGVLGCFADWKVGYSPSRQLFDQV